MKQIFFITLVIFTISSCKSEKDSPITTSYEWQRSVNYDVDFYYMYQDEDSMVKVEIIESLLEAAFSGDHQVYLDDEKLQPVSAEYVKAMFNPQQDTAYVPTDNGGSEMVVFERQLLAEELESVRFLEEWSYDKKNFQMHKKVIAAAPGKVVYDPDGDKLGIERVFWIFFED